ncbi:hypothetical protein IQ249_24170 [Lusitaniella coriacea LEGE 07157]|uniref:SPOR domain-containing protein n=1 Tax=Lusitaniella coriacea LEGE 07157 TaxID=945747 RepID=A0A8J7E349_9CYAN|nr:hypothetical protein [Lusitaniella coriacea]MBE9118991.1 hypothetical protein [Lusitaniella coriacea LEGE 07157]
MQAFRYLRTMFWVLPLFGWAFWMGKATAQVSACPPPASNEYLVLVVTETRESHQLVRSTLPNNTPIAVCEYLGDRVTRISGFRRLEEADRWGRFMNSVVGLYAVVVEPGSSPVAPSPSSNTGYNPQPLGTGYAVLIDYFNQPEMAGQVQQFLGRNVGLASYFSRPYLLAVHTQNEAEANAMLRRLSDRGFSALVVDSSRTVLLSPVVNY